MGFIWQAPITYRYTLHVKSELGYWYKGFRWRTLGLSMAVLISAGWALWTLYLATPQAFPQMLIYVALATPIAVTLVLFGQALAEVASVMLVWATLKALAFHAATASFFRVTGALKRIIQPAAITDPETTNPSVSKEINPVRDMVGSIAPLFAITKVPYRLYALSCTLLE